MKVFPAIVLLIILCGFSFAAPVPPGDIDRCLDMMLPGTYTLTSDLVDGLISLESGNEGCFWIRGSDIVLDCAGHSISTTAYADSGIYANGVYDNITVKNCNINNFSESILIHGNASGNITGLKVLNNTLNGTSDDMTIRDVDGALIDGNTADPTLTFQAISNSIISNNLVNGSNSAGMVIQNCINNTIENNTALNSGKDGILVDYSTGNLFTNNLVAQSGGAGFRLDENSDGNTFIGNTVRNNSLDNFLRGGFDVYSTNNNFINNTAQNNSNGFYLAYGMNNLSGNHILHNNIGLNLDVQSTSNIITDNLIEENLYADLLAAGDPRLLSFSESGCSNTIENNTGSGGNPILYSEEPVNLVGGTYSEIFLCGADGSYLEGVTVEGSDVFDNNALALFFTDLTLINNTQSNGNAMGIWIHNSELVGVNGSETSENALAGMLITFSRNIYVNDHLGHDNDGAMPNFFDDENPFIAAIPFGAGVLEIGDFPGLEREAAMRGIGLLEMTYYNNTEFYGNNYGMMFMLTPNVTVNNSKIHDNGYFGILDATGSDIGMRVINTDLYRNGADVLEFMGSTYGDERASPVELPEGLLWAEVIDTNYVISQQFYGGEVSSPWELEMARHGAGISSVLMSLDDGAQGLYITSETNMPASGQFEYFDGIYNRTVFLNFTDPANLSAVNGKYFVILDMSDQKGGGAIDQFTVLWESYEFSGYDPETAELYYLNVTEIIRPKSVEPVNITVLADWLPVPDQTRGTGRIVVDNLAQPEARFLRNFFPELPDYNFYEGVYGLFAEPIPGSEDDGGQTSTERLSVSVSSDCEGTTVSVSDSDGPVSGASVLVSNSDTLTSLAIGSTDSSGKFSFDDCGLVVRIYVNKNGYSPVTLSRTISCCSDDGGIEPEVEPEPEPEPQPEPEPAPEPEPEEPPQCPGECGSEAYCGACSSGYTCVDYTCEKNEVSGEDGFVGDSKKVKVRIGDEPCPLCDIQVTAPDGKTFTGKTDENGEFTLPLSIEGVYKVALVDENGDVSAEATVNSMAKPTPSEEEKPTEEKPGEDYGWMFLVFLLAAAVLFIIYKARGHKS